MTKKQFIIYAGGLFDGEGCIYISKQLTKRSKSFCYSLFISVGMISINPLKLLQKYFGGSISFTKKKKPNHSQGYTWIVTNTKAIFFLKTIYPYSLIKKEQTDNAIEFREHMDFFKKIFQQTKKQRSVSLPKKVIKDRERFFQKAKILKKNHH